MNFTLLRRASDSSAPLVICYHCGPQLVGSIPPSWGLAAILLPSYAGPPPSSEIDDARAATGAHGPLVLVGWSAGCQRVRELLRAGAYPAAVVALDGTSGDVPPTPEQLSPWHEVCGLAVEGHMCTVLTCTQQTYTEHLRLDRDGHAPFAATVRVVSEVALPHLPVGLAAPLPPGTYTAGNLRVEIHASAPIDGEAHKREVNEHGPRILREVVVPYLETGAPGDTLESLPPVIQAPPRIEISPFRAAIVARARGEIGVKESPVNVVMYVPYTLRNGKLINVQGQPWCARFASWCVWRADPTADVHSLGWRPELRGGPGGLPPFAIRAAVWELIEDARLCGAFFDVEHSYESREGDLICYGRDGQDPRKRGHMGHVAIDIGGGRAVSGNLDDRVEEHDHDLSGRGLPLVGFIRTEA